MTFDDVKVGMRIKTKLKPDRVWQVTAFNESCLLLKTFYPVWVISGHTYVAAYLPTVFLENYEVVNEVPV